MILPALGTLLIPSVGLPPLLKPGGCAAAGTAIPMAPITVLTDPEHCVTALMQANPLTQNRFAVNRHAHRRRGLDNDDPIMSA